MDLSKIELERIDGTKESMEKYLGNILLIVNTASKCGFTPQFEGLEKLYETYKDQGLEILGFPCNQFANQDAGENTEINEFCQLNYGVTFTMFQKIKVNGKEAHPLYQFLKKEAKGALSVTIKWNFTKFLIDRDGQVIERFAPKTEPEEMEEEIKKLL